MNHSSAERKWLAALPTVFCAGLAAIAIGYILYMFRRGFDITDEAFYVFSARDPELVFFSISTFGYFLKPLFNLVNEQIAHFRQIGVLVLCVAAIAAWLPWRGQFDGQPSSVYRIEHYSTAVVIAAMPLFYYAHGIPTPSYNWLALLSGLLLVGAFGFATRPGKANAIAGAVYSGSSGVAALSAKPTSAAFYAVLYLIALMVGSRSRSEFAYRFLWSAAATVVLLLLGFVLLVPYERAIELHRAYYDILVRPGHVRDELKILVGIPRFVVSGDALPLLLAVATFGVALIYRMRPLLRSLRWLVWGGVALSIGAVVLMPWYEPWKHRFGIVMLSFAALALAAVLASCRIDPRAAAVLGLVLLIPAGATAGSANYFAAQFAFFAGIPAIVVVEAMRRLRPNGVVLPSVASAVLLTFLASAIYIGVNAPYRVATPLAAQELPLEIGSRHGVLLVDAGTKDLFDGMRAQAVAAGFKVGSPIFDLTSRLPGVVLVLGGYPPAAPWLFSGTNPQSESILEFVVQNTPAHVRRDAWIVWGEVYRAFPRDVMEKLGFRLDVDYRCVVRQTHKALGGTICIYAPQHP